MWRLMLVNEVFTVTARGQRSSSVTPHVFAPDALSEQMPFLPCKTVFPFFFSFSREWNVERLLEAAQKVLPHPSFVYCSQYHPTAQNLVLTGGYDTVVRLWRLDVDEVNGQLLEEFEGHSSFINTLCFDTEGIELISK